MFWSTININRLAKQFLPIALRNSQTLAPVYSFLQPLQTIADETLYKMQHNGTKIYLEKMLNEAYAVAGYNTQDHEGTKLIYIEDVAEPDKLYVWQNEEPFESFLEDDGDDNPDDVFLDGDIEDYNATSFIIFMPDTITFTEITLRALVDSYRYIGKKYTVEIYTP
ncbi:hypothetical protein [Flavobacterium sp.]